MMPDKEKVLKGFTECMKRFHNPETGCVECPYRPPNKAVNCWDRLFGDVVQLLREQEKTPVVFHQCDGSVETECGNCGCYLDKTYSRCPQCGKELDWNA